MRPNILLIVLDSARADAFEPYGAPAGASPTVAQLASAGAAATTFSTACWSVPSHMSLLSGLLPRSAGFRWAGPIHAYRPQLHALRPRLLPSVLAGAGYQTLGLSANMWISPVTGFDIGFEELVFVRGRRMQNLGGATWRKRARWYEAAVKAQLDGGADELGRRLEGWLSKRARRPFFWFVNLAECQAPYLAPKPYNDLTTLERLRAGRDLRRHLTFPSVWKYATGCFDVPDSSVARIRRLYEASVRRVDDWLAQALEALSRHGLREDTQVIVTSDHGENLGDARRLGHLFSLDDRLLRVPLVSAGPYDLPPSGIPSLRAAAGWLADIAGIPNHPFPSPSAIDVPVAQFDAPLDAGDPQVAAAIRSWGLGGDIAEETVRRLTTSFECATDGSVKLVRRLGQEELFDLSADPLEEEPLIVTREKERAYARHLGPLRTALDRAEAERQPVS